MQKMCIRDSTKPMSQIDEFKTYDEVLTASYTGGNTGIDHGTDLD